MNEAHIKELFENQEFVQSIMELETPEEVQAALAKEDLDISLEEVQQIYNILANHVVGDQELTEEELESVNGGMIIAMILGFIAFVAFGATAITMDARRRRW
jgi:lactobin A/cerein 7B family class IIb bacteriocin